MSEIKLTRSVFKLLVKHLVEIEDERDRILKDYYPSLTREREGFQQMINQYINEIENKICNADIQDEEGGSCPFVIIGSVVELEDLKSMEIERLQIISPFINKLNVNSNCASYLSPLGRALLLKGSGERAEIETPAGRELYRIKSIKLQ